MSNIPDNERPITIDNRFLFADYTKAAKHLLHIGDDESYSISRRFPFDVTGKLVEAQGKQFLTLTRLGVTSFVERSVDDVDTGVIVSTAADPFIDVTAHPEDWEIDLLDRGLSWVRLGHRPTDTPLFLAEVLPGHGLTDPEAVANRLAAAEFCCVQLIESVLRSEPTPAFSHTPRS